MKRKKLSTKQVESLKWIELELNKINLYDKEWPQRIIEIYRLWDEEKIKRKKFPKAPRTSFPQYVCATGNTSPYYYGRPEEWQRFVSLYHAHYMQKAELEKKKTASESIVVKATLVIKKVFMSPQLELNF